MLRRKSVLVPLITAAAVAALVVYSQSPRPKEIAMPQATAFRILFGLTDKAPTVWDGRATVASGKVLNIQGWRFTAQDSTDGASSWKLSTRNGQAPNGAPAGSKGPMLENGVILTLSTDDLSAPVTIDTRRGSLSFRPSDVVWGTGTKFLYNAVQVSRVPATWQLTNSFEEQDFPAAAQEGDDVWVAYVEFVHGDRSKALPSPLREEPRNFDALARPAGGDQVMLVRYSKSGRVWSEPMAVSAPAQDVVRTAVAVDGGKRVWVFWSANKDGNYDLYARSYAGGKWSTESRLSWDPGTDLNPVAATDSGGRVWVAWQGFRGGNLNVLVAAQNGDTFTPEATVSASEASDWDPAIAAGPNGEVAVAWDTYDKGDYDVYLRRMRFEREILMASPVPVAASLAFEARASIAYDAQGRLWAAYETAPAGWGKDFGAYESTGVALYVGHSVQVRCFQGNDEFETVSPVVSVLPSAPSAGSYGQGKIGSPADLPQPDPKLAANRKPNGGTQMPALPRNSFPRLAVDPQGTIYVAFRSSSAVRVGAGTIWFEQLVYFDGAQWRGPLPIPNTDGLLDHRPALVPMGAGQVLMVSAMDHRQSPAAVSRNGLDPVNTDLYAAEFRIDRNQQGPRLRVVYEQLAEPAPAPEAEQIDLMRSYRVSAGGAYMRLLRGEFHRHTEISGDGGGDGPVIDAYRYLIDVSSMDWGGCCDHDNGGGREYFWWLEQKLTDAYQLDGKYTPMFSYERSVQYPEGHRNVVFAQRGVRTLPRLPKTSPDSSPDSAPDTRMLYHYLRQFGGAAASHTSGTDMGTDWRDNDPALEPMVEIYQGDRQNYERPEAPRSNSAQDSIGGWRPLGFVSLALDKGFRLGFESSSDHISTHMSYANVWATAPTREAIMQAIYLRRIYAATDNILADVRVGDHFMGEEFDVSDPPVLTVKLWGSANFARVHVIKDNQYVYTVEPGTRNVDFSWRDNGAQKGKTSFYYVRGEQADGELVWASPMWITYR